MPRVIVDQIGRFFGLVDPDDIAPALEARVVAGAAPGHDAPSALGAAAGDKVRACIHGDDERARAILANEELVEVEGPGGTEVAGSFVEVREGITLGTARTRKLEQVGHVITRSGMYATHGRELQGVAQGLLGDLCFIDERDNDAEAVGATLHRYGKLGVAGAFESVFGDTCSYVAEVASIFAEQFHRLGYLEVGRQLSESEWDPASNGLRDTFEELDVRQSEVRERLGEPSLVVDKRVYCYVTASPARWMFFDFWENPAVVYEPGQGRFGQARSNDDLLLRDIRTQADTFNAGLVLTLYGKVLRWGPGWWLEHPSVRAARTPTGVREQLRDIADADPSQSLGPRRP